MTRETKVGLLIGTLILLLVGIVVSDHLAVKQEQDRLSSEQFAGIQPPSVPGDINVGDGVSGGGTGNPSANLGGPGSVIPTIGELGGDRNLDSIVPGFNQRNNEVNGGPSNANSDGNTGGNARVENNSNESVARNNATNAADARANALRNLLQTHNLLDNGNRPAGTREDSGNTPANSGNNNASNIRPVIHYVKPGETLWAIADQYYGDGNKWKIIKSHNKDRVPSDNQVREGVRLEIPNRVVEGGVASNGATNGGASGTTNNRTSIERTVTVKSGDNLTRIAQVHLGSITHVDLILKANRDKIRNADQIRVGMVLRMPAIPSQPAVTNDNSNRSNATDRTRTPANNGAPTHAAPVNEIATSTSPRKYVVQGGDTLSAVAEETLGNKNRWKEIWNLNKTRIPNPNVLSEGIALTLPARER